MATLALRRLGKRLTYMRQQSRMSTYDVEATKILSRRSLGRLERGESAPAWPVVTALADLYEAPTALKSQLREMAMASTGRTWGERFAGAPPDFNLLPELEADAESICIYEAELVPGLVQTPEYARAVIESSPLIGDDDQERAIRSRVERRAVLDNRHPPRLRVLMTEGALTRVVGDRDVHTDQIEQLRKYHARSNVEVRVLPGDAGAYAATIGPFTYLKLSDPLDPEVVYLESLLGSTYVEAHEAVGKYALAFNASWDQAKEITDMSQWTKSSRSGASGGNCVEARSLNGVAQVRDSKLGEQSPILSVSRAEWHGLLSVAKR